MKKVLFPLIACTLSLAALAILSLGSNAWSADPPAKKPSLDLPKATERHRGFSDQVGDWIITGQTYEGSPYGAGKFTATQHVELLRGGLFMMKRTQYSELFNNSEQIDIHGVDPNSGEFTYFGFNSLGIVINAGKSRRVNQDAVSLTGNTIEWSDLRMNVGSHDAVAPEVYTNEYTSKDEYKFSLRRGDKVTYDGVAKRVVQKPAQ